MVGALIGEAFHGVPIQKNAIVETIIMNETKRMAAASMAISYSAAIRLIRSASASAFAAICAAASKCFSARVAAM